MRDEVAGDSTGVPLLACPLPWGPDTFLSFMETTNTKPEQPVLHSPRQKAHMAALCVWVFSYPVPAKNANILSCHVAILRYNTFLNAKLRLNQGTNVHWNPIQIVGITSRHIIFNESPYNHQKIIYNQLLPSSCVSALTKESSWSSLRSQSSPMPHYAALSSACFSLNFCTSILGQ